MAADSNGSAFVSFFAVKLRQSRGFWEWLWPRGWACAARHRLVFHPRQFLGSTAVMTTASQYSVHVVPAVSR